MALWVEKSGLPSTGLTVGSGSGTPVWGLQNSPPGAFVGGKFYLTGGSSPYDSPSAQYETYEYDPATDSWTLVRDGSNNPVLVPHARADTTGAAVGNRFCTLGQDPAADVLPYPGNPPSSRQTFLDYYVPSTKTWATITPSSGAVRYNVWNNACVGYGNRLYSFGGVADGYGGSFQDRGYWYDFSTDTWGETASWRSVYDHSIYYQGGVAYGSKIYLFGGEHGGLFDFTPCLATLIYDPAADTWTTGTSLPNRMWTPIVGVIGTSIWLTGKHAGTGKTLEYDVAANTYTDHTEADHLTDGWNGAGGSDGTNLYHACPGGNWQNQYSHVDYATHAFGENGRHAMLQLLPKHWGKKATMSGAGTIAGGTVTAITPAYVYPGSITVLG